VQRILALAAVALLLAWGACVARRALASDETRIRWLIDGAVEGFNAGRPGSAVAPLADTWWDRTSGLHKDTLHQLLVGMAFQDKDARGRFLWRVDVPADKVAIEVGADGTAHAKLEAAFARKREDALEPMWTIAVDADLRAGDGGWEVVGTEHRTLSGSRR
jgi:hypothetical protein